MNSRAWYDYAISHGGNTSRSSLFEDEIVDCYSSLTAASIVLSRTLRLKRLSHSPFANTSTHKHGSVRLTHAKLSSMSFGIPGPR